MLKTLAVLAVLLAAVTTPPIPRQAPDHRGDSGNNPEQPAEGGKNPPQPTVTLIEKNCDSEKFKNDSECKTSENKENTVVISKLPPANVSIQSNPKRDIFDWVAYVFSVVLAVAGIFAVFIGCRTLRWLRVQTIATRKAANAALKQANHAAASERAWLIVSSEFLDGLSAGDQHTVTRFKWSIKNVGNTPARLLEFDGVASRADRGNIPFPDPPRFYGPPRPLNKLLLVPNDSFGVMAMIEGDSLSSDEVDSVKGWGKLTMVSYGYIKYLDVFGEEHTTRFCQEFWFNRKKKEETFLPRIKAPASYTDCD